MIGSPAFEDVYVVHARRLAERRAHCERAFAGLGWRPVWIETFDGGNGRPASTRHLRRGERDVYLKHLEVLRRVAGRRTALVLEDDPIFPEGFEESFREQLRALPLDFDIVFFGASCGLTAEPDPGNPCFGRAHDTRSMSGYLVTDRCAALLVDELERRPMAAPIDLTVNALIRERSLAVYWSVPALIGNGSEAGRFERSLGGVAWPGRAAVRRIARQLGWR